MLASFARGDRQRRDVGGVREGLSWRCCIERPPPPPHPYRPHWMNSQMGGEHLALLMIVCTAHQFTCAVVEKCFAINAITIGFKLETHHEKALLHILHSVIANALLALDKFPEKGRENFSLLIFHTAN